MHNSVILPNQWVWITFFLWCSMEQNVLIGEMNQIRVFITPGVRQITFWIMFLAQLSWVEQCNSELQKVVPNNSKILKGKMRRIKISTHDFSRWNCDWYINSNIPNPTIIVATMVLFILSLSITHRTIKLL